MNRTQKPASTPKISHKSKMAPTHIDLYNFDDPEFEDSKYVMTSPRSLEACSRLGVKPVEILYKPLIDFQEDLLTEGYSLSTIFEVFDEHERERQNKLQLCREERGRVIAEDEAMGVTKDCGPDREDLSLQDLAVQEQVENCNAGRTFVQTVGGKTTDVTAIRRSAGSVQRQRTAWTTSVGHKRITENELNKRAQELYDLGRKKSGVRSRRRSKSAPGRRSNTANSNTASSADYNSLRKKQARLRKAERHQVSQESIPDESSVTSSRAGRPWIKDPLADVAPVTDPVLRQRLQSVTSPAKLSSRRSTVDGTQNKSQSVPVMKTSDQKILQLMIAKREEEKKRDLQREKVRAKWEEDRKREASARNSAENQRRRSMSSDKKSSSPSKHHHLHNGTTEPCSCGRDHDRQVETPCRGVRQEATSRRHSTVEEGGEQCRRNWVMASQKRQEMQARQLQEKKAREMERKKSVEKRLEEQKREKEEYHNKLKEKQEAALHRAESVRLSKDQQRELTTKLKNFQAQQRHKESMNILKRQSMEDLAAMRASIDLKDHLAHRKQKEIEGSDIRENKRKSLDLDSRMQQYKGNKSKMEEQLHSWQTELQQYRQLQEQRAEQLAKDNIVQKSRKANEHRRAKEQAQKDNMKKLMSAEDEWKAEVEAAIALKDSKSKMIKREKEDIIHESRAMAQASQRLREEFRQHYSMNDLDKLNKQAELEARFTSRPVRPKTGAL